MLKWIVGGVSAVIWLLIAAILVLGFVVPLPAPALSVSVRHEVVLDSSKAPPIAQPATGSFAVGTNLDGDIVSRDAGKALPIASMAKTMSALAVLTVHPLKPGESGPTITVTQTDVGYIAQVVAMGGSYAPVVAGEVLSERDLLVGMMLPSANNFALMAAVWVDGSVPAFVARLNHMATAMGTTSAHFDDPDGLTDTTVASAHDLLILARAAAANNALTAITKLPQATLPAGTGVVHNIDAPLLSIPGWLGIKTGHTFAAGYCLLFAAEGESVHGVPPVQVVGVVMGQTTREATFSAAAAAVKSTLAGYVTLNSADVHPEVSGGVEASWGASSGLRTRGADDWLTVRRGTSVAPALSRTTPAEWDRAGAVVGRVTALVGSAAGSVGRRAVSWDVVTVSPLGPPGFWRRVTVRL